MLVGVGGCGLQGFFERIDALVHLFDKSLEHGHLLELEWMYAGGFCRFHGGTRVLCIGGCGACSSSWDGGSISAKCLFGGKPVISWLAVRCGRHGGKHGVVENNFELGSLGAAGSCGLGLV